MRAVARIAAGFACLVALAVLAAWFVPQTLDWNRYRADIATLATRQLGQTVRIDGPVSLTLLPQPALLVSRVTVDEGGAGVRMSVKVARLKVALWPLFAGRIDVQDLALRGLDLQVPGPLNGSAVNLRPPDWLRAQSAQVEDGRVAIGDVVFDGIDATLSAGDGVGGYRAAGTTNLSGQSWRFTGRLNQSGGDGSTAVDATLDGQGRLLGVGLKLSGQLDAEGAFGGRAVLNGPDLSQLLAAPHLPFRAEGRVSVASGLAAADDLQAEIGGSPVRAAVAFRLASVPRLDVALAASTLDLDLWLPFLVRGRPSVLALGIDVSAEAASLAGGTLRRLRAAFDWTGDQIAIRELRASLPGDADLQVSGRLLRNGSADREFDGDARLSASSVRPLLVWLNAAGFAALPALPVDWVRGAQLAAHLNVRDGILGLRELAGTLDGSRVAGDLTAQIDGRLRVKGRLDVSRVDLASLDPFGRLRMAEFDAWSRGLDLDLGLKVDRLTFPGGAVAPLLIDAALEGGQLAVRRFAATAGDVRVAASGRVDPGIRLTDARLAVDAGSLEAFAPLLPEALRPALDRLSVLARRNFSLRLVANGPVRALGLKVTADLDDLRLEAEPSIDIAGGRLSGPVTLRHPGASRLVETLGLRGAPAWLGDGSLALVAAVAVTPARIGAGSIDLTAGALHATGDLAMDLAARAIAGHVVADTLPLPLPVPRSLEPLGSEWLTGWSANVNLRARAVELQGLATLQDASAKLVLANGRVVLDTLRARMAGGELTAAMTFDAGVRPPNATLQALLAGATVDGPLFDTPFDVASGTITVRLALSASGYSPAAMVSSLAGTMQAEASGGHVTGIDLGAMGRDLSEPAVRAALAGGSAPFDRIAVAGAFDRGSLTLSDATLASGQGSIRATGSIVLTSGLADIHLRVQPRQPDAPAVGLRITGALDSPRRTPELVDLAEWLARPRALGDPAMGNPAAGDPTAGNPAGVSAPAR